MKAISVLLCLAILCGLYGCSSRPPLEELEREAIATGDWSKVEKRKRMNRKMGLYNPDEQCPSGQALYCVKKGETEQCRCVSSNVLR